MDMQMEKSRNHILQGEFTQSYFMNIKSFLLEEEKQGKILYPSGSQIFTAFNETLFADVNVVILGQDPYHGDGQAHGLSFSVPDGIRMPPSLRNIHKEIISDLGGTMPESGNLLHRAQQGVLLLNTVLTVEAHQPASHKKIGRERFTDSVIHLLSEKKTGLIFILRGNFARTKKVLIDDTKHTILEAPHPSPFSAYTGFFGCKHFSMTNTILQKQGKQPIKRILD